MSTTLKKMMSVATAFAILFVLSAGSESFAQRDAGAKARGDFSSFWSQDSGRSYARPSFSNQGRVQTRRSFSYQPAPAASAPAPAAAGKCPPATESKAVEQKSTDAQPAETPQAVRRSYSYEPTMRTESRRTYSRGQAARERGKSILLTPRAERY